MGQEEKQEDLDFKLRLLEKQIEETFVDSVRGLPNNDLKDKMVELNKEIRDNKEAQKQNTVIKDLKEKLKDLNKGYSDLNTEKSKRLKYILLLLESRGKV